MKKMTGPLEFATWSALIALFACEGVREKIYFSLAVLIVFLLADSLKIILKRILLSPFQALLFLVVAATLFGIAHLRYSFSGDTDSSFLIIASAFILSFSSTGFFERMKGGFYFLFLMLLGIAVQGLRPGLFSNFYPALFLVAAFNVLILKGLLTVRRGGKT